MRTHLQALQKSRGIHATLVVQNSGQLLDHMADALFDRSMLKTISSAMAQLLVAAEMDNEDWRCLSAIFLDGQLIVYRIDETHALVILANHSFDPGYLHIGARVTTKKLKKMLANGYRKQTTRKKKLDAQPTEPTKPKPRAKRRKTAKAALYWPPSAEDSVAVVDTDMSAFLDHCAKAMAFSVGPVARALVKKIARKIAGDRPLSAVQRKTLVDTLANHIPYEQERVIFRRKVALT